VSEEKQSAKTVAAAAKLNTGNRREGDVLGYRANGRVVELHRGDVVLAKVLWWRGMVRGELSTRSRRRRRTVAVGDEVSVAIGKQQGVEEHQRAMGKLARGWIGVEEAW
jgi:hypothetical protein